MVAVVKQSVWKERIKKGTFYDLKVSETILTQLYNIFLYLYNNHDASRWLGVINIYLHPSFFHHEFRIEPVHFNIFANISRKSTIFHITKKHYIKE